ncbi:MAG: DNA translocase FtsK [Alistipes sp.]|nr:DNA translocase FtsK [Alistipes sp.]
MATDKRERVEEYEQLSTADNIRLIAGFVLILIGAFLFSSIVSYLFYWAEDMSAIAEIGVPMATPEFNNICGRGGALVAHRLVGEGFGLFAVAISLLFLILGWRLFRYKPLKIYRFLLILSLVLVLGSLTMGYIFGTAWGVFGSGLGGEYGVALDAWLSDMIGGVGTLLLIILGWIMTGLLINRNFLQVVDNAGEQVAGGISMATRKAFGRLQKRKGESKDEEMADTEPTEASADEEREYEEFIIGGGEQQPAEDIAEVKTEEQESTEDVDDDYPFVVEPIEDGDAEEEVVEPVDVDDILGLAGDESGDAEGNDVEAEDNLVVTVKQYKPKDAEEQPLDMELYDPMLDLAHYTPPTAQLLVDHKSTNEIDEEEIFRNKERIRETLLHFHIPIISMTATVGPTVTLYEIVQEPGVKISRIQGLEDDLAQNLKAQSVRIIAPMPGKGTVGIEVPNHTKQTVSMRSSICSEEFQNSKAELPVVIGRTIQNENYTFDLAKLPHLLVAGATGQGKSVGLNAIITSLLYRKHPAELKFVLIDPKMVEFSLYNKLEKHFLAKMESEDESIVTDPKKAVYTLNALCTEMSNRLELCKKAHAKNIVEYNDKFVKRQLNPENGHRFLPYIVVVIDEFADLIMTAKEVEAPVMRLAQKARAIGIHLIVATQRPDVKVITGGIKANFPARIAFRVMQMTDSRTIIDQPGANQLIGRGDMLFLSGGEPIRIQCAFVDTPEVERIVDHIGAQQGYSSAYNLPDYTPEAGGDAGVSLGSEESGAPQKFDPKFAEIAREAVTSGVISTSMIQRNFEVGFNRAGRIMLQLERAGIVGPQIGSKQREIRYYDLPSLEARLQELGIF